MKKKVILVLWTLVTVLSSSHLLEAKCKTVVTNCLFLTSYDAKQICGTCTAQEGPGNVVACTCCSKQKPLSEDNPYCELLSSRKRR